MDTNAYGARVHAEELGDRWVLVTCSTEYQGEEELARVAVVGPSVTNGM